MPRYTTVLYCRTRQKYRATHVDFSFLRLLGLTCKEMNFYARQFLVGHIEHSNGFVRVVFVFRVLLMRSI